MDVEDFFEFVDEKVSFYTGVPDSLLKPLCSIIEDRAQNHIIAANEGGAVAIAAGQYLATQKPGLVYMQNSGQGNAVNPLLSLVDKEVYAIPLLIIIGWRGEPGKPDEPQHRTQGRVTKAMLDIMQIPNQILSESIDEARTQLQHAFGSMKQTNSPYAFIVRKNTFSHYEKEVSKESLMSREEAVELILDTVGDEVLVTPTGKCSREVFEYREKKSQTHERDFLTVGSMGHTSQIALGLSMATKRNIYCIDGDGSLIMHMGGMPIIGKHAGSNFKHIVLNNNAHDSVGGQLTSADAINFPMVALGCGYRYAVTATSKKDVVKALEHISKIQGPILVEIKVRRGARKELGRPTTTPKENKDKLMEYLQ